MACWPWRAPLPAAQLEQTRHKEAEGDTHVDAEAADERTTRLGAGRELQPKRAVAVDDPQGAENSVVLGGHHDG